MRTPNALRALLLTSCFASVMAVSVACDDGGDTDTTTNADDPDTSGDGDTGDGDGDGDGECNGSLYGEQGECTEYVTCVETNCGSIYESCFGADYLNGNFGGSCADYMSCNLACECGDTDCTTECYNTHAAMGSPCGDCLVNDIGTCVATNCLDAAQSCG